MSARAFALRHIDGENVLPFFYNIVNGSLATGNLAMRASAAIMFCLISTATQAQSGAAHTDPPKAGGVRVIADEKTLIYKTATVAPPHCDGVIDDQSLREMVQRQAREIGVDEKLALVILNLESRDGAELNSPKGARGPMQLMPATAAQYGVRDICNPEQNVHGAMLFLKDLAAQYSGNVMLIAAAYNAGAERVHRANGVPANPETVRYVASAANQYYGLGPLSARRGKTLPPAPEKSGVVDVAGVSTAKPESRKNQDWIGGSVLYVQSAEQGDK